MRDKGLVFDEMRRQRRVLAGSVMQEWFFWAVVVAVLLVAASFAARAAQARGEPASLGGLHTSDEHEAKGFARHDGRVTRSAR